tara:strand:+ start:55 stop:171 length:117 start_codon:yes stop_codon:yes gene_type:complete
MPLMQQLLFTTMDKTKSRNENIATANALNILKRWLSFS